MYLKTCMYIFPIKFYLLILSDSTLYPTAKETAAMISRPTDTAHSTSPMTIAATFPLVSLAASSQAHNYNVTIS